MENNFLKIKNLTKTFNEKKVLNNVSVDIPESSIFVFLGESGVGKSTLLRVLAGIESYESGYISVDGAIIDPSDHRKDHTIGMVFQEFNLFEHMTVGQNIILPQQKVLGLSESQAKENAINLLKKFGLENKIDAYPSNLSGGQKQRIAIARTLAVKPKIICMDEPTSALDPVLTTYVADSIQRLSDEGYTILIATHDVAILDKLDCIINFMQNGKIVEQVKSKDLTPDYPLIQKFLNQI